MTRFRKAMRIHTVLACSAAMCGLLLATPAVAINLDQVRAKCAKNPNCHAVPQDPNAGGGDFCMDEGRTTCDKLISCPGDLTDCWVIGIVAGKRKALPNISVDKALQAPLR